MDVSKYIAEFLTSKGQVLLPGLGSFSSTYQPAHVDKNGNTLFPPSRVYSFDPDKKEADNGLSRYIAGRENSPVSIAEKEVEEYVEGCHYVINKGKRLEIPGVGLLFHNEAGLISFEQDPGLVTEGDFYGLPKVKLKPARKINSYALAKIIMVVFIVAALVWAGFYAQQISLLFKETFSSRTIKPVDSSLAKKDTIPETQETAKINPATPVVAEQAKDTLNPVSEQQLHVTEKTAQEGPQYYIVAGCFRLEEGALSTAQKLKSRGFNAKVFGKSKQGLNMVCYDSFQNRVEATTYLKKILTETDSNAWLIKY